MKVICKETLTEKFEINTGVKQGCTLSPFLFSLAIDWIMKESTDYRKETGIRWTFFETLEDLDFADDIVLLSQKFSDMKNKTREVAKNAIKLGLTINTRKTKTMRMNSTMNNNLIIDGKDIEEVDHFIYLGSKMTRNGDSAPDIEERLTKARKAYGTLSTFWKSSKISRKVKLKIFKSNVLSVLLYGCES